MVDLRSRILIIYVSRCVHWSDFWSLELVIKPDSLLLEDERSETSSEGHNKTYSMFIKLVILCVAAFTSYLIIADSRKKIRIAPLRVSTRSPGCCTESKYRKELERQRTHSNFERLLG